MEWISGNVFIRPMGGKDGLRPGDVVKGHLHNYDHTSIFFSGLWQVRRWQPIVNEAGEPQRLPDGSQAFYETDNFEREGPFHLLIEANSLHEFTFLGPGMARAWCVYSHRNPQGDVAEHYSGWIEAYQ